MSCLNLKIPLKYFHSLPTRFTFQQLILLGKMGNIFGKEVKGRLFRSTWLKKLDLSNSQMMTNEMDIKTVLIYMKYLGNLSLHLCASHFNNISIVFKYIFAISGERRPEASYIPPVLLESKIRTKLKVDVFRNTAFECTSQRKKGN